jgi:hypothetical protein
MATSEADVNRQNDAGHATPGKTPDNSGVEASSFECLCADEREISYSVVSERYEFAGRMVQA